MFFIDFVSESMTTLERLDFKIADFLNKKTVRYALKACLHDRYTL